MAPAQQLTQNQRRPALGKHLGRQRHGTELTVSAHAPSLARSAEMATTVFELVSAVAVRDSASKGDTIHGHDDEQQ
jgi:hypothetical protein